MVLPGTLQGLVQGTHSRHGEVAFLARQGDSLEWCISRWQTTIGNAAGVWHEGGTGYAFCMLDSDCLPDTARAMIGLGASHMSHKMSTETHLAN